MKTKHKKITILSESMQTSQWTPGLVKNVAVCGTRSKNGYTYRESALKSVLTQYDEKEIYLDHQGKVTTNRTIAEHFATIRKPFWDAQAKTVKVGEFSYRREHPFAKQFEEQLKRGEKWFRLSHVVDVDPDEITRGVGGVYIESIAKVRGVDLVTGAATTQSLFEQTITEEEGEMVGEEPDGDEGGGNLEAAALEGAAADCAAILSDEGMDRAAKVAAFEKLLDKLEGLVDLEPEEEEEETPAVPAKAESEQVKALEAKILTLTEQVNLLLNPPKPKKYIGKRQIVEQEQVVAYQGVDLDNPESMRDFWNSN